MVRLAVTCALCAFGSGCFLFEWIWKSGSGHGEVEEPEAKGAYANVPAVWSRHLHGSGRPGEWARYRIDGGELEIACVAEGWYEFREGKTASARQVAAGRVTRALYAEEPYAVVVEQEIVETPESMAAPGFEPIALTKVGETTAGGCVIETYEDDLGFSVEVRTEWAKGISGLYAERNGEGLARRSAPGRTIELLAWGSDATARLKIP